MPLGVKPECAKCGARETPLWHATDTGNFCNSCLEEEKSNVGDCGSGMTRTDEEDERSGSRASRKSTRITRYCKPKNSGTGGTSLGGTSGSNNNNNNNINGNSNNSNDTGGNNHNNNNNNDNNHSYNNNNHNCNNNNGHSSNNTNHNSNNNNNNNSTIVAKSVPKGRGRRHIFKKMPIKAPAATATPVTSNFVFYKGTYFQVGDIVSLQDVNGKTYYAQIRGLLTDQYCEKSAAITWLLPTTSSPPPEEGFIPETYILGPEEDLPRKLEYMEFVMHSPSDYYKLKNSPYPPPLTETGSGYIWTTLRNEMMSFRK